MRSLQSKRGQVQTLSPAILSLVFAAIVLVLGLVIQQEIRDTDVLTQVNSATVSNETLTTVSETGELVARSSAPGFNSLTVDKIYKTNATDNLTISSANYTVNSATGRISFSSPAASDAATINNSNWLVSSYTYKYGDEAWLSANQTIGGLGTFADFWQIIVLAIVTTVVIGLLLVVFGRRGGR